MKYYFAAIMNSFGFSGRASRKEFWMFVLFYIIFTVIALRLDSIIGKTGTGLYYGTITFYYGIALFMPGLAITIRRLHDIGKSGWYILVMFIPIFGNFWFLFLLVSDSVPVKEQAQKQSSTEQKTSKKKASQQEVKSENNIKNGSNDETQIHKLIGIVENEQINIEERCDAIKKIAEIDEGQLHDIYFGYLEENPIGELGDLIESILWPPNYKTKPCVLCSDETNYLLGLGENKIGLHMVGIPETYIICQSCCKDKNGDERDTEEIQTQIINLPKGKRKRSIIEEED